MVDVTLTKTGMAAGRWEGLLTLSAEAETPRIEVLLHGEVVPDVSLKALDTPGEHLLTVPVPPAAIADGVQIFVIRDAGTGAILNSFAILAGEVQRDSLLAEVEFLRAELDLLKQAFRRHCVETDPR